MPDVAEVGIAAGGLLAIWMARKLLFAPTPVAQAHRRGRRLQTPQEVTVALAQRRRADDPGLLIGRQVFPSDIATRHFAFIGTTGSGKTLLQRLLMQCALRRVGQGRGQRALVYDAKQDLLSIMAGMEIDCPIHILNPLDARAVAWDMAKDVDSPAAALQTAASLAPETQNDANPFFTNAARQLIYGTLLALIERAGGRWSFRQALLLLRDPPRLQALLDACNSTRHLLNFFAHSTTAQNIFSTVLTYTTPYEIIAACWDRADEAVSLASWTNEESILVLGNGEENRAAIDTLNRLIFRRISELVLAQDETGDDSRRTWIFLDEIREAGLGGGKLDSSLSRLLTKGRTKGAAVVLGFQDISGMRQAYGREVADELLGQCNTKIILRLNSPETAAWAAKLFGSREVLETRRGKSRSQRYSLNAEASLGESVSNAIVQQPLVLDSEIMGLAETSREAGIKALIINPTTGPFEEHIEGGWLAKHLLPPEPTARNFIPRPVSHQYLRPWGEQDDALVGFEPSAHGPSHQRFACEGRPWCQ